MSEDKKLPIRSFRDLQVYQKSYACMLKVVTEILPKLPESERYDLRDQLNRSCKAIPRLIAEGYAKRHQKAGFQKYLDDAMAETNETAASLEQCRDIYGSRLDQKLCTDLISTYDILGRQLYMLAIKWRSFDKRPPPSP